MLDARRCPHASRASGGISLASWRQCARCQMAFLPCHGSEPKMSSAARNRGGCIPRPPRRQLQARISERSSGIRKIDFGSRPAYRCLPLACAPYGLQPVRNTSKMSAPSGISVVLKPGSDGQSLAKNRTLWLCWSRRPTVRRSMGFRSQSPELHSAQQSNHSEAAQMPADRSSRRGVGVGRRDAPARAGGCIWNESVFQNPGHLHTDASAGGSTFKSPAGFYAKLASSTLNHRPLTVGERSW
jgi:hypothetical protein